MTSFSSLLVPQPSQGQTSSQTDAWAKLISFGPGLENVNLTKSCYTIGRNATNDIKIPDIKLSGQHCKIIKDDQGNFWVEDTSSNGTFIDNELIGKGKKKQVNSGDKIFLLHQSKVKVTEVIGYVFSVIVTESSDLKRKREEELKSLEEEKKIIEKQSKFEEQVGEEMMCCICIDFIYNCVTSIPCLHNFCASCFSEWMVKSTACPQCREEVTEIKKNATVNNMIQKFMENNPSKKRPKEEYEEMDQKNKIKEDKVVLKKPATNTTSLFGAPNNARTNTTSLFGVATNVRTTGGSLFSGRVTTANNRNTYNRNNYNNRSRNNYRRPYYEDDEDFNSDDYDPEESEESESDSEEEDEYD